MRWQRAAVVGSALAVIVGAIMSGCTDGVTPDCSDAAACAPSLDGAIPVEGAVFPEASRPDVTTDGGDGGADAADADADVIADAGNEN